MWPSSVNALSQNWGREEHIRLQFVNREYKLLRSDICGTLNMLFFGLCIDRMWVSCFLYHVDSMGTPVLGNIAVEFAVNLL